MVEPAVLPGLRSFAELWVLIDASMPDPERFVAAVAELEEDALIERYADVFTARQRVRVKWAGPFIDAAIGHLSEDSTEDLCDWVVGQGSAIWAAACGAADATLVALFAWSEAEFQQRLAGTAIYRIGHERWLRNLAVGLGNAESTPEVLAALQSRANDDSALVREHVAWALAQHALRAAQVAPRGL